MRIVGGFIAVVIPHITTICPHNDGWGVIIYGRQPTEDNPSGIVEKYFAKTVEEGKSWTARRIAEFQGSCASEDETLELCWESLVCNPVEWSADGGGRALSRKKKLAAKV
jgi:hypothetical protein